MPGTGPKALNCIVCSKRTKPKDRRKINKDVKHYLKRLFLTPTDTDVICNKCKHKYYLAETKQPIENKDSDPDYEPYLSNRTIPAASPPSVSLKIHSTSKTHARCLVCKRPGPKLLVLSSNARYNAFIETGTLIPAGTRCCPVHLNEDGDITSGSLEGVALADKSTLNRSTIVQLVNHMREVCRHSQDKIDFDRINDPDCRNITGISREDFLNLFTHISDKIKGTPSRSPKTSLGLFLLKLKSGMSNKLLSTIFRISRSSIRRALATVRQALMRSFVPLYLGLESVTREEIIKSHTRALAKTLFDVGENELILVLDGTYIYIQKSQNFTFQRRSFSFHKARPLVKPMIVVSTTGHYITIVGPYLADSKNNDASILNHMLRKNIEDIRDFLQENDLLVVDRGFRDSLALLEDLGIKAAMPAFMKKGVTQMPTEDANTSRLVTKVQ